MNAFFFGSSERPLFGVHHPAAAVGTPQRGAVLCPPLGHEYMRAHRAIRRLAEELTQRGIHAFRFDYYGTGDSAGDSGSTNVEQCTEDVRCAIEELRENGPLDRVVVVGLRFGAALATLATRARPDVEGLVLWDPVTDGSRYSEESAQPVPCAGVEGVDLRSEDVVPTVPTLIVSSSSDPDDQELIAAWSARHVTIRRQHVEMDGDWNEADPGGSVLVPASVIQVIANRIAADGW